MYIIGENIHILSDKVKEAIKVKDAKFFQELAVKQVEAGAQALDKPRSTQSRLDGHVPLDCQNRGSGRGCAAFY
jgi:hypothetical protein